MRYGDSELVRVARAEPGGKLAAEVLNGTDTMELRVFANAARGQAVLVARFDNLGKGASGAAVQNIGLILGVETRARAEAAYAG